MKKGAFLLFATGAVIVLVVVSLVIAFGLQKENNGGDGGSSYYKGGNGDDAGCSHGKVACGANCCFPGQACEGGQCFGEVKPYLALPNIPGNKQDITGSHIPRGWSMGKFCGSQRDYVSCPHCNLHAI